MTTEHTAKEHLVGDAEATRLAQAHGLPEIEVEAAFAGERVEEAEAILSWIDEEEGKLTHAYGLLEGRRRYKPLQMLKNYARRHEYGRYGQRRG